MEGQIHSVVVYAVLTVILAVVYIANSIERDESKYCECDKAVINRRGFPDGFIFGSSSAAYQVEGGYNENGKGPSIWDHFTHAYPDRVKDHTNGDVAVDSYHLYKEDVKILKDMGVDAYRFSISWPRILPGGALSKGVNQDGIDYYNNLINELLANGIQPWVAILHLEPSTSSGRCIWRVFKRSDCCHHDVPNRGDFQDYADLLFNQFGDRVKQWITINEPQTLSFLGYNLGVFPPSRCSHWMQNNCTVGNSATEPYIVMHNQLLAHAAAVKLYRNKYQKVQMGKTGIIVNSIWYVPYDQTHENLEATDRAFDFVLGWIMDPITYGKYPVRMIARAGGRLPNFTKEEADIVKGSFDFVGVNYYTARYVLSTADPTNDHVSYSTDCGFVNTGEKDGIPLGEQGYKGSRYYSYPKGLRRVLRYIKEKYNNPLIYITENGSDETRSDNLTISEAIKDYKRKDYLFEHLCCLREAIEDDDANVKGYFTWSLTDNFDWKAGFTIRMGLYYIDLADPSLKRYPKLSAKWFKSIMGRTTEEKPQQGRISDE